MIATNTFNKISPAEVVLRRDCWAYTLEIHFLVVNDKLKVTAEYEGNIPTSVLMSIMRPETWDVGFGSCVKFSFAWVFVAHLEGKIVECRELSSAERESYPPPKPRRNTYVDKEAIRATHKGRGATVATVT